jgi:hypothetical protein
VLSLAIPLLQGQLLNGQDLKAPTPAAPIPAQISAARKISIANAGGDDRAYEEPYFKGGPNRAYDQFYAALKSWGHLELTPAPADADLLLEIRFSYPRVEQQIVRGDSLGGIAYDPQFRLEIRNPKTNALLWGITEHAQWAILRGNRDRNFDQTLARLVADRERIVTQSTAPSDPSKKP